MSISPRTIGALLAATSTLAAGLARGQAPTVLPPLEALDVEANGRLFERGIPVTAESFSKDGFYFAYLHQVPGGFLRRKPERCAFLLDLGSGDNRPTKAPTGRASRLGGWDASGRHILLETVQPDFFSAITGNWNTYHWIYDVVASQFIARKPFTGRRDGRRFLWKQKGAYHGAWAPDGQTVWPLYEGELSEIYQKRERTLAEEDARRLAVAHRVAVGSGAAPSRVLGEVLARLDAHWTQRGSRDPVVSELFGERPALYTLAGDRWIPIQQEVEYVAVLDHSLVLITGRDGAQSILDADRLELAPLPAPPPAFARLLNERWDRSAGFYDELDPLPRDLQYRRSFDLAQGIGHYFNFVLADRSRLLVLYSMSSTERVLRVVELPPAWRAPES
jgi:hypothetical protein